MRRIRLSSIAADIFYYTFDRGLSIMDVTIEVNEEGL